MVGMDDCLRPRAAREERRDAPGCAGLCGVRVEHVRPPGAQDRAKLHGSPLSRGAATARAAARAADARSTPSSSARYSIDSSPAASVPATTSDVVSAPPLLARELEHVQRRAADVQPGDDVHDRELRRAHSRRCTSLAAATTPSVSQKIAVERRAAEERRARERAQRATRARRPAGRPASGSRAAGGSPPRRATHRERRAARAEHGSDEPELEEHLVVGLLRDERRRRLAGSSGAAGPRSARVRPAGSARTRPAAARRASRCRAPAGRGRRGRRCRRRSAAGSSSPRTGPASPAGGPNQDCRKPRSPSRSASVPAGRGDQRPRASPSSAGSREVAAPDCAIDQDDRGGEVDTQQAGERGAEDDADARPATSPVIASTPGLPGARAAARGRLRAAIVASAARSCSPMNDALAACGLR